jgi:glycosyltransferase involved in cell wall biosynthesis
MNIVIATGIYPPEVGGPAQFAKGTENALRALGHDVKVFKFRDVGFLPTGVRHLVFFLKVLFSLRGVDFIFSPDTFSAALPATLAAKMLGKKIIIRTGGDFLWEWYVERTGDLVLLRDFYRTRMNRLTFKERTIFYLVRCLFRSADAVIFSTAWQKGLFEEPYRVRSERAFIVENYYGNRLPPLPPARKNFVGSARPLRWKNNARVAEAFERARAAGAADVVFDDAPITGNEAFIDKIRRSYAVIVATLGDISPNTVLDAIRCGKPFIMTRESGFSEKLHDIALLVDPESVDDIAEKIRFLADDDNYRRQQDKVRQFTFTHSWEDIAREILDVYGRARSHSGKFRTT